MNKAIFLVFLAILIPLGAYKFIDRSSLLGSKDDSKILLEAVRPSESQSTDWWLIFGGLMHIENDSWSTLHGDLNADDPIRKNYLRVNPLDTDNGYHPQNIFKLITQNDSNHLTQEIIFRIDKDRPSRSPNKNAASGFFLIENYKDIDNFYQIGFEIDGKVVIRKKLNGIYSTLAESQIWGEAGSYDNDTKLSFLPQGEEISFKVEKSQDEKTQMFKVWLKNENEWELILDTKDTQDILPLGKAGIMSDFMDVTIQDYRFDNVSAVKQGANWQ